MVTDVTQIEYKYFMSDWCVIIRKYVSQTQTVIFFPKTNQILLVPKPNHVVKLNLNKCLFVCLNLTKMQSKNKNKTADPVSACHPAYDPLSLHRAGLSCASLLCVRLLILELFCPTAAKMD